MDNALKHKVSSYMMKTYHEGEIRARQAGGVMNG